MFSRRYFMAASLGFAMSACKARASTESERPLDDRLAAKLQKLEKTAQGRLGVHVLDAARGRELGHRSDERFMMMSTFKLLLSAFVLARVDRGLESLQRRIAYGRKDVVPWSPVTEKHAEGEGMTVADLCHAAMTSSDNTAANLLLQSFGGPLALTGFLREHGDGATRLDRFEPELNAQVSGNHFDTTTPRAMAKSVSKLVLGDALSPQSRELLRGWLIANKTGDKRLRAGVPASWKIGEKTGTGDNGTNDVGVIWAPSGAPLVVAAYLDTDRVPKELREQTLADVGRLVVELAQT